MKKIFFILSLFVTVLSVNAQSTKIDFDYSKIFNVKYLYIDYNGNGEIDEGESYASNENFEIIVTLQYKDFDTAGNLANMEMIFRNKKSGKESRAVCNFEDIDLIREKKKYKENEKNDDDYYFDYIILNKLGDSEVAIIEKKNITTLGIFNAAYIKAILR